MMHVVLALQEAAGGNRLGSRNPSGFGACSFSFGFAVRQFEEMYECGGCLANSLRYKDETRNCWGHFGGELR